MVDERNDEVCSIFLFGNFAVAGISVFVGFTAEYIAFIKHHSY